jgi:hypothetical protein
MGLGKVLCFDFPEYFAESSFLKKHKKSTTKTNIKSISH